MKENFGENIEAEQAEIRERNAGQVIDGALGLTPQGKVLFIEDENPNNTDRELIDALKSSMAQKGIEFSELFANDKTTQKDLFDAMESCDLVWNSWDMEETDESVDFDQLTEHLEETEKRMAFCPGLTADCLDESGALTENMDELGVRLEKMESRLKDAYGFRVKSNYGTDLTIRMKKGERRWFKDKGVIEKGNWDNLPGGEIFTTPDEENVDGVLVLPVLQDEVTRDQGVDEFVRLTIVKGKIRRVDGGESAKKLRDYLNKNAKAEKDPESVLQCAEIAFGANSKARTVVADAVGGWNKQGRATVETEKRLGTMHLAFGSSKHGEMGTEGHTESDVHLDFVIPRNGLTVEKFTNKDDFKDKSNGEKLINQGSWNLV